MSVAKFFRSEAGFRCAVFALGFLLSWLPLVVTQPTIAEPDELFQFLETGHRLVFGYGLVPWEFDYAARSWALGYAAALPMALAGLLGQGPAFYLPLTWALFALGAASTILSAGLWGKRFSGHLGGWTAAVVAACWTDNLFFGGRVLSETVGAHLLIVAVYLAEPGYRVESRKKLGLAGFLAALAVVLRLQLAPAALLFWLWHWRDARRLVSLAAGGLVALLLDGGFDTFTTGYPFQPLWQNIRFNLLLNGADAFGMAPWWYYFGQIWAHAGFMAVPAIALVLLGGRRQKLLLAMAGATLAVHVVIPHKEYRFLLPVMMMAAILCGLGAAEVVRWLRAKLEPRWGRRAVTATVLAAGLGWLGLAAANAAAIIGADAWRTNAALLEMVSYAGRQPAICGLGFGNVTVYGTGGYTFLHRPIPTYHSVGAEQDFISSQPAFNGLVLRKNDMDYFESLHVFGGYALEHCNDVACLLLRPGGCAGQPNRHPPIGALSAATASDPRYPYAVGIGRK